MTRVLGLLALAAGAALGSTITYTFTAIASGSFEGNAYTGSLLTITALADSSLPEEPLPVTISVGSFSDTVNNQSPFVFSSTGACSSSPEFPAVSSCVGFEDMHGEVLVIANNVLAGYVVGAAIGPIDDATPFFTPSTIADHGTITITGARDGTFQASGGSSSTPEPATLLLLPIGISVFLLRRRALRNTFPADCSHRGKKDDSKRFLDSASSESYSAPFVSFFP